MADALFREQLISVQGWLAAHESGDDAAVLGDRAVDAARQLAGSTAVDAVLADEARPALAQFWWHRFWALPPGRNGSELDDDAGLPELMESIELLRVASQATEVDKEERAAFLANEAELGTQAGVTRGDRDLCEAILLFTSALGPDPAVPAAERPRLRVAAARLTEWAATGDASVLFDPELTAVLADLATVNPRNPPDLSALCMAGWLHLLRYNFAGQEEEQAELLAAAGALHPVYLVAPFAVPDPVASLYADDKQEVEEPGAAPLSPGNDEYHRVNAAAMQLMSRYAASGDLGTLREAVSGFRRAVAVTASDAESVAVVHNNLALALLPADAGSADRRP